VPFRNGFKLTHSATLQRSIPCVFLLELWRNCSLQASPSARLGCGSHTTFRDSTALFGFPVGAMENYGRYSRAAHRLSKSPLLHSQVLENSHVSQARASTRLRLDSHFSYSPTGASIFSLTLYTLIHLRLIAQFARPLHRPLGPNAMAAAATALPCWQLPIIQRIGPVFHASVTSKIATIRVMKRGRFRVSASCCTVRA
jgi:hypothetical protein